jgi:hypothetical protein
MDDGITQAQASDEQSENRMGRVRFLRKQADWCVEMATKAINPQMFQKYIELAAAYQQQAADLERYVGPKRARV